MDTFYTFPQEPVFLWGCCISLFIEGCLLLGLTILFHRPFWRQLFCLIPFAGTVFAFQDALNAHQISQFRLTHPDIVGGLPLGVINYFQTRALYYAIIVVAFLLVGSMLILLPQKKKG